MTTLDIFDSYITRTDSESRLRVEKFFNSSAAQKFRFRIVLPSEHDYIGKTVNGKHEGEGVAITENDVIIGNFANGILKNGVIHNKNNNYITYVLDFKTVINVVGTELFMIHNYGLDCYNKCLFIALYMDSSNTTLYSNVHGGEVRFSNASQKIVDISASEITFHGNLYTYNNRQWYRSDIKVNFSRFRHNKLSKLYNNYTDSKKPHRIVFDIDIIPDSIVDKPVMSTRFLSVLHGLGIDCINPRVGEPEEETKTG